jgi:type I restriction enzyme S subunit
MQSGAENNEELKKEIPEGWKTFSLASLIKESKNGDWGNDAAGDECIKSFCVRGADIDGLNGLENFDPPTRYIDKSHSNRQLKPDDLIIEISGGSPTQSTGRIAHVSQDVLDRLYNKVVCSNFCKAISLKNTKLSYIVNRYWSHLYESKVFFNHEGKTSGIKNLLFDQLVKDVKIAIPIDGSLINTYYEFEDNIDKQKQNNLQQNEKLIKLRDWLLPMLMNGQVKIN